MTDRRLILMAALACGPVAVTRHEEPAPEQNALHFERQPYHGQPRSLKETRRAQRRGTRR